MDEKQLQRMKFCITNLEVDDETAMGTYVGYIAAKTASILTPHSRLFLFVLLGTLPVTIPLGLITSPLVYVSRKIMFSQIPEYQKLQKKINKELQQTKQSQTFVEKQISQQSWNQAVEKVQQQIFVKNNKLLVIITEWQQKSTQKNAQEHIFIVNQDTTVQQLKQVLRKKIQNEESSLYLTLNMKIIDSETKILELKSSNEQKIVKLSYATMQTFG